MEFHDYKAWLIDQVENTAWWRSEKAAEYPDDDRNMAASQSLTELAEKLKEVPADHPKIRELWRIEFGLRPSGASSEDLGSYVVEAVSFELRAFGFSGGAYTDPEDFLDSLINVYQRELEGR
jgi:hypothetical protein